jgi:type II secretory pathway pseudopilin PulG
MNNKLRAFSLIEMAMVLIIMGMVGGFALPLLKGVLDNQKNKITEQNQERILYALAGYANQNKMLPYAADPQNINGKEDKATYRRRGIIPYADLGIPESIAKDGYQRWLTYIVDDHYAVTPPIASHGSTLQPTMYRLCEKHAHPNPLKMRGLQENVAVVLISHGPQGRGAYPNPLSVPPLGIDEQQNTISEHEIIDRPISSNPAHPFSHKVAWVTARNLLAMYGHAPCPPAREEIPMSSGMRYELPQHSE